MAETQVVGHLGPPEVQEAVPQPDVLGRQHRALLLGHLERQRPRGVEELGVLDEHFQLPGGVAGVLGPGDTIPDHSGDRDYRLSAEGLEHPFQALAVFLPGHGLGVEHRLGGAVRVSQVEEENSAMVSGESYPAGQLYMLSQLIGAQFSAGVCPHHFQTSLKVAVSSQYVAPT
jgi:hypothetical protein